MSYLSGAEQFIGVSEEKKNYFVREILNMEIRIA